ncbi:hypothetical protein ABEF95_011718 [Exophiala dermatitidis]
MATRGSIYDAVTEVKDKVTGTERAQSGEEPRSGVQGEGTLEDPYDQGNVERPSESGEEPPSGIQGKGTATDPYDAGNAPENPTSSESRTTTSAPSTNPSITTTTVSDTSAAPKSATSDATETRGRDPLKAPRRREEDYEVSPGTLPDGTHAQTSGDRGEGYEPGRLSRLKGKFAFGKH